MIELAIPAPKPATRFASRANAFSARLFSGALIASPPAIAALMTFFSAPTRWGEPTYEEFSLKIELPVEFSMEWRIALFDGGFTLDDE